MSKEPSGPLFTIAYDDFIRSPKLTDREFRLYMVMLSYCTKKRSDAAKLCKLPQEVMAGILGVTERTVYNLLRSLEKKGIIQINSMVTDNRYPVYTVVSLPPPGLCPDELRGSRTRDAMDHIRNEGGVKSLQRRHHATKPKVLRRTGRPKKQSDDAPVDDDVSQPPENSSPVDSRAGNRFLPEPETGFIRAGNRFLPDRKPVSGSAGNRFLPGTDVQDEFSSDRPNGLCETPTASSSRKTPRTPGTSVADGEEGCTDPDINDGLEDGVAQETPEQKAERLARIKAQRVGSRSKINDVTKADETPQEAKKKGFRGAGPPPGAKDDTTGFVEKHLSESPSSPWSLYGHFCRVVRGAYPGAHLPKAGNGKYLRWGKTLLKDYSPDDLYEMIRIHVLDFDNINRARVFFKLGGTATPTFEQFFSNAEMLATYIGKGVIAPPAVRFSTYLADYNKRKGIKNDISNEGGDQGRTDVDPIEALRDQVNG